MPEKRCSKCGVEKPLADFHRNAAAKDGLQHRCKTCILAKLPSPQVEINMSRQEIHSANMPIEQLPPIANPADYDGDILVGEKVINHDYAAALAFNEEPVTIRMEPSSDVNADNFFPVWVNGQGAELFLQGRWIATNGYLPVGEVITVRRKIVENILRAKRTRINTKIEDEHGERPNNVIMRNTSSAQTVSIIQDRNPRGAAWATEIMRRNM